MGFAVRGATMRHEVQVVGPWLLALPIFVAGLFVIAAGTMALKQAHPLDIQHMVMAGIEGGLPLAVGITCATIAAQEPALEVQLTVPLPYRLTVARRLGLVVGLGAAIEATAVVMLALVWPWALASASSAYLLTWLPTLLWFAGWGALLALLLGNRAASVAVLGVVWVFELAFHGIFLLYAWTRPLYIYATMFSPGASYWLLNRLELLATGLALFVVVWLYLGNAERRLRGEDR